MSGSMGVGSRFVLPLQQIVDPAGVPYVGAHAYFYATGTSTFQNTYADVALTIPNANPVVTNSAGMFPNIFMMPSPAYRVRLTDPSDAVIYDCDPVGPATGSVPGSVPVGGIQVYAGTTPPTGWMWCDGSAVSRTAFSSLFAAIGTTFGAGDGATTFNLPDLRGRVIAGVDGMGGVAANRLTSGGSGVNAAILGGTGGDELLQSHTHTLTDPGHIHYDSGHTHGSDARAWPTPGGSLSGGGNFAVDFPYATISTGYAVITSGTTDITIASDGAGAGQNAQPTMVLYYIIWAG